MADAQTQSSALQGVEFEGGDFASLLNKEFKPQTDEAKSAVESAIARLRRSKKTPFPACARKGVEFLTSLDRS